MKRLIDALLTLCLAALFYVLAAGACSKTEPTQHMVAAPIPQSVPVVPSTVVVAGDLFKHTHIADVSLQVKSAFHHQDQDGWLCTIRINGNQVLAEISDGQLQSMLTTPAGTWVRVLAEARADQ